MQDTQKRQFYRSFFSIVVPIAIQQLITAAVGVADTLMLGYVNQTALAAGSLAGQIQFLLNMINGGLAAGITILSAQYWGRGDLSAVEKVLAIGLKISVFVGAVFFPEALMRIYTDEPDMIAAGAEYLRVVGFSYLFLSLSQPYLSAMKSIEQVRVSTVLNSVALVLNIGLNAAFIFGWIPGIPPLGFIAAFVWNLPPLWVYLILNCDEFAKMPFVYIRYRQKKWLRNITKEVTA